MTQIVVSRRDGILRAPDGTRHRVARGRTLAEADHPAVLANPGDWSPMVVTLTTPGRPERSAAALPGGAEVPASHAQVEQFENDLAELEETLASRDAELGRLVDGLAALGVRLPAEDGRTPGWLVDLVLDTLANATTSAAPAAPTGFDQAQPAGVAPPTRKGRRSVPPLTTRTGDDG